jgi:protein-tyrosine phosphatase
VIDFHNHLIPGVDDGAADLSESRAGLAAMRDHGVRTVVCTPHIRASLAGTPAAHQAYLEQVDAAWDGLRALAADEFPELRVERGFEVMLDVPSPDMADPRLRLGGTRFVLIEFPFMSIPANAGPAVYEMAMRGWTPVIAHPERYSNLAPDLQEPEAWKRSGALLQVNAGSLLGKYGERARSSAWGLLQRGLVDFVCSDFHARGSIHLAAARAELERAGAGAQAALLMNDNAERMLRGESPLPVAPVAKAGVPLWRRILGRGR